MLSKGLATFTASLSEAELLACARVVGKDYSRLSPFLTAQNPTAPPDPDLWNELEIAEITEPGGSRQLTPSWRDTFHTLARPSSRLDVKLGNADGFEVATFYAGDAVDQNSLVSYPPAVDGEHRITFPVSPQDVATLLIGHVVVDDIGPQTGFAETFTAAEYGTLLAAAATLSELTGDEWPELVAASLAELWDREENSTPISPIFWGRFIAPADIVIDTAVIADVLASLRSRSLLLSLGDGAYAPTEEMMRVLRSFNDLQSYAAVEFRTEAAEEGMVGSDFTIFLGGGALWLLEFVVRDGAELAVSIRSIGHEHIDWSLERLARLSALAENPRELSEPEVAVNTSASDAASDERTYELNAGEIAVLIETTGRPLAPWSPLASLERAPEAARREAEQVLRQRGLLANGAPTQLSRDVDRLVAALSQPSVSIVEVGGLLPEFSISRRFVSADEPIFAAAYGYRGPEQYIVSFPIGSERIFPITQNLVARGLGSAIAPFAAVLGYPDYQVLLAIVDLCRLALLEAMLSRETALRLPITAAKVNDVYRKGLSGNDRRWLVTAAREVSPLPFDLEEDQVGRAFAHLTELGHLKKAGPSPADAHFELSPDGAAFCLSLTRTVAALGVALNVAGKTGTQITAGVTAFWADGRIWMADYGRDESSAIRISLQTVLPIELTLGLRVALRQACEAARSQSQPTRPGTRWTVLAEAPSDNVEEQPGMPIPQRNCSSCGQSIEPESRFCPNCGVRVAAPSTDGRRAANGRRPGDLPE